MHLNTKTHPTFSYCLSIDKILFALICRGKQACNITEEGTSGGGRTLREADIIKRDSIATVLSKRRQRMSISMVE